MGNWYTNIIVKDATFVEVKKSLHDLGRHAYIAEVSQNITAVFDSETEKMDIDILASLASELSSRNNCIAMAIMNCDDDQFFLGLYVSGQLRLDYNSHQWNLTSISSLIRAFGRGNSLTLWLTLVRLFIFQINRHTLLLKRLGLPKWLAGSGFEYISNNDCPLSYAKVKNHQLKLVAF